MALVGYNDERVLFPGGYVAEIEGDSHFVFDILPPAGSVIVEIQRTAAAERLEQLAKRLAAIDADSLSRPLKVRSEQTVPGIPEWCGSTLHRELQFLASHTVHHYALIVALLGRLGYELEPEHADFGIAPSTLEHWNEADQLAG